MKRNRKAAIQLSDKTRDGIAALVRAELADILSEEAPLDAARCQQLRSVLDATEPLLRIGLGAPRPQSGAIYQSPVMGYGETPEDYGMDGDALAPSSVPETFGTKMLREIVAMVPALMQPKATLTDLVASAAAAKDAGMPELEASLREEIAARLKAESPPATASEQPQQRPEAPELAPAAQSAGLS